MVVFGAETVKIGAEKTVLGSLVNKVQAHKVVLKVEALFLGFIEEGRGDTMDQIAKSGVCSQEQIDRKAIKQESGVVEAGQAVVTPNAANQAADQAGGRASLGVIEIFDSPTVNPAPWTLNPKQGLVL